MAMIAFWYVENHIIFLQNIGNLSSASIHAVDGDLIDLMHQAATSGSEQVHVLVDATLVDHLPIVAAFQSGPLFQYFNEAVCGSTLVVGDTGNHDLNIFYSLLASTTNAPILLVESMEEAIDYIREIDPAADRILSEE
jgi:hypothetical protein